MHLEGMTVIVAALASIYFLSSIYYKNVLNLDNEDYPNNELTTEGMANSVGMFIVSKKMRVFIQLCIVNLGNMFHVRLKWRN